MVYTAYSESEWETLPDRYRKEVVGIRESGEVMQVPLCPECGGECANIYDDYLSCVECGSIRKLRVLG